MFSIPFSSINSFELKQNDFLNFSSLLLSLKTNNFCLIHDDYMISFKVNQISMSLFNLLLKVKNKSLEGDSSDVVRHYKHKMKVRTFLSHCLQN